ncbi:MAG: phosphotransferase family protein [Pseudonocardia sp.]|uniref:phosphotransferase family protein n=1 Tax=unclassified Pseudonocardia TaxID=2619320 RepID=UPI00086C27C7|nr:MULTISPECIES: phosphotransferase family protein [unclassified Pseudonocardia]MBN9109419.1 phosphotransferase family protein [Pseudonocardia sp.]ODU29940.1 MAG: hypothetical protein ABS80_00985 [Pseudonocardia sp. SCN 72-51]ODV08122.1 MAG: hypothetical protein ABT15_05415 [Pseudonocardia sp. SCN 73-27]
MAEQVRDAQPQPALVRDPVMLRRFLDSCVELPAGELEVRLLAGGLSNVTLLAGVGERHYVLRRPPIGPSDPAAHDVRREFLILSALATSRLPTPEVYGFCPDSDALGAPFVVVEYIEGRVLHTPDDAVGIAPATARRLCEALVDTLVDLHDTPIDQEPFAGWHRPEPFAARRLHRWIEQWRRGAHADEPRIELLGTELLARAPARDEKTLVHGDYRFGNLIVDVSETPRVAAILDWELCTVGDPLTDLAQVVVYADPANDRITHPGQRLTGLPGFLTAEELVERYLAGSGRRAEDLDFYVAFSHWRSAIIKTGIRERAAAAGEHERASGLADIVHTHLQIAGDLLDRESSHRL